MIMRLPRVLLLSALCLNIRHSFSVCNERLSPANAICVCPGEILIFTCTAISSNDTGGAATIWNGSAFNCPENEISLIHSRFSVNVGVSGECNNRAIVGRSLGVNGSCYTSELNITVSTELNNKTVACFLSPMMRQIGHTLITAVAGIDPPSSVLLMDVHGGKATFKWARVHVQRPCTSVTTTYNISSNCSTCNPTITNLTTTSCPVPEPTTDVIVCAFSIQSVACDGIVGSSRNSEVVTLHNKASRVDIIPHYCNLTNKTLSKLKIHGVNLTIATSDNNAIFITEYTVSFSDPTTGTILNLTNIPTCGRDACETDITLTSLVLCRSIMNVSADNGFGQRMLSDPVTVGCTNQFVDVHYNSTASTISCTFLNQMDISIKSCRVIYGECNQKYKQTIQGITSLIFPNTILLTIMPNSSFCYAVTASNGNFTLVVEGSVHVPKSDIDDMNVDSTNSIIAGTVTAAFFIVISPISLIIAIAVIKKVVKRPRNSNDELINKLYLNEITVRKFRHHQVYKDCSLRDAIEKQLNRKFKQGRAYYEFSHRVENITEDEEIIFMHKETRKIFTPTVEDSVLQQHGLRGRAVPKKSFTNYIMLIQSSGPGSGERYLPSRSILLYERDN